MHIVLIIDCNSAQIYVTPLVTNNVYKPVKTEIYSPIRGEDQEALRRQAPTLPAILNILHPSIHGTSFRISVTVINKDKKETVKEKKITCMPLSP